jgi:hypothetical protein
MFEALGDPHFDDRLAGDSEALRFPVKRFDHPYRKVHVYPALLPP